MLIGVVSQWNLIEQRHMDIERGRSKGAGRIGPTESSKDGRSVTAVGPSREVASRRELAAYVSQVKPLVQMWREAFTRIETGSIETVAMALATLRDVESRAAAVIPPNEARGVHYRLLAAMCSARQKCEAAKGDSTAPVLERVSVDNARRALDAAATVFETYPANAI